MDKCVIASAARTPVGTFLGALKTVPPENLASHVMKEALKRSQLDGKQIDEVIFGHVQANAECGNLAHHASLLAGLPEEVPGYTLDRQCASSLQTVANAVQQIQSGNADVVMAGGTESMSRIIYYLPPTARFEPYRMGHVQVVDAFLQGGWSSAPAEIYNKVTMGLTAENVAVLHNISREAQDEFALHSQQKAAKAMQEGRFADEIIPYEIQTKKGSVIVDTDEHPKPQTSLEGLAKLKPAFKKDGTVTAGNASGMNDAAVATLVMSETKANSLGLKPLARIIDFTATGLDPKIMGLGPVSSIQKLLKRTGMQLEDIDLFELNEAFAAQSLGVLKELGMLPGTAMYDRVNVNGGAIALGHPLGASGGRILTTLMYELKRQNKRYGIASMCIGGGQGMAMLVEAL